MRVLSRIEGKFNISGHFSRTSYNTTREKQRKALAESTHNSHVTCFFTLTKTIPHGHPYNVLLIVAWKNLKNSTDCVCIIFDNLEILKGIDDI